MAQLNPEHTLAYYTVANAPHYPGAVALLNSLRLLGDEAPFFVVDCGLTASQQDALSGHATLVPQSGNFHPALQKATGPLSHSAGIMVLLDADVIVNRPLTPLFEDAAVGRVVAFEERISDRFFQEWASLGIGVPNQQPYVSSGHFIIPSDLGTEFLPLFDKLQKQLDIEDTFFSADAVCSPTTNPYFYADQDIFNAILCTRYANRVVRLERRLWSYPPFEGLRMSASNDLMCGYSDGSAPYLLHHFGAKPWLTSLKPTLYSELFTQVVSHTDAPIRLGRREIPLRLGDRRFAPIDRWRASLQAEAHRRLRGKLGLRPVFERQLRRAIRWTRN